MDRLFERTLRWAGWIWSALWVVSLFLSGALFGAVAAVTVLVLGVAGTFVIEQQRLQYDDPDRQTRITDAGSRRSRESDGPRQRSTAPSIYDHLLRHLPPPGQPLDAAGLRLPDDAPPDGQRIRWAPGAQDGVAVYHGFSDADPEVVDGLIAQLVAPRSSRSDHRVWLPSRMP